MIAAKSSSISTYNKMLCTPDSVVKCLPYVYLSFLTLCIPLYIKVKIECSYVIGFGLSPLIFFGQGLSYFMPNLRLYSALYKVIPGLVQEKLRLPEIWTE